MRLKDLPAVTALLLFVAYFAPIAVKLRDIPLAVVVAGGIVLVAVDVWESMSDRAG